MSGRHSPQGVLRGIDSFAHGHWPERCVQVRNPQRRLHAVRRVCTSGCITVDEARWRRPEALRGCGTCATVCPTCALEARG